MRRIALLAILLLLTGSAFGQVRVSTDEDEELTQEIETVTHSELAMMVLRVLAGDTENVPPPNVSYQILLNMGLIPSDWVEDEILTHGELEELLLKFGANAIYVLHKTKVPDPDEPASRDYTEAMLRRALGDVREYPFIVFGEGFWRRPVSPYKFQ